MRKVETEREREREREGGATIAHLPCCPVDDQVKVSNAGLPLCEVADTSPALWNLVL